MYHQNLINNKVNRAHFAVVRALISANMDQFKSKVSGIFGLVLLLGASGVALACVPTVNGVTSPIIAGAGQLQMGGGNNQVNGAPITGTGTGSVGAPGATSNLTAGALPALSPAAFPTASLGAGTTTTAGPVAAGSYGTLNVTGNPTVFTGGTYYINTLNVNGGPITLGPGTYFINTMNMTGNGVNTPNLTVTGAVQIYIGNALNINSANNVSFNAGGSVANLQVNLYPNSQFDTNGNNFSFTGLVYAPYASTQVDFAGNNTTITGAVVAAGQVQFGNNTNVVFGATQQAQISGLNCGIGSNVDHFQISHPGSGLTCSTQAVTVTACANAACSSFVGGTNVTLQPGGAVVTTSAAGPVAGTVAKTTAGAVTLSATSVTATTGATQCANTTTGAAASVAACTNAMTFSNAGFLITVPNHISCNNATATIESVQTGGAGRCVPAYQNVTRAVNLYTSYANPTAGTQSVTASTGAVSTTAPGTAHNLAFDGTGKATITLSYPDAGQLTLTASGTAPTGAAMTGSGNFVVAPASLAFSGIPAAPLMAGQPFNVTLTAMNACATPAKTANFAGHVTLTSSNPLPAAGNATPINTPLALVAGTGSSNLTWNEVGTLTLNATLANYLGSALTVNGTQAGVGRFQPAYFETLVTPACGTFTYAGATTPAKTGQPFTVVVTAKALTGTVTANYSGAFAYANTLSNAGVVTGFVNNAIPAANFAGGIASTNAVTYNVATLQTAPVMLTLRAVDADIPAVSSLGHVEGAMQVRSGRIKMMNTYGSELRNLAMPLNAQYWNGSAYVQNTADNCSTLTVPALTLVPAGTAVTFSIAHSPLLQGDAGLRLNKTNVAGYVDVTANVATWLQYVWAGGGLSNPTARATFGVYKGSDAMIYLREAY